MQEKILREAAQHMKQNRQKRIRNMLVRVMACIVVFCTTYALILPAITMEKQRCGLEEHTHSESCYKKVAAEPVKILSCTYETLGVHVHTAACYDSEKGLVCGLADYVIHSHNDDCRDENGNVVCGLPVVQEHTHTEACYSTPEAGETHTHSEACYTKGRGEQICGKAETEGHTHSDDCYTRGELVCQLSEQEGHTHGAECSEKVLTCELTVEAHQHTDSCYQQQVCELAEDETHTHSDACSGKVLSCELTEQPHNHTDGCYQTKLLCDLPETEGHTHTDSCYAADLVCEKAEEEAHSHSDSCFEETYTLTCGLEEGTPAETEAEPELVCEKEVIQRHTHDEASCYESSEDGTQKWLICDKPQVTAHVHGESCFVTEEAEEDTLTCGLTEGHTHGDACKDENGVLTCTEVENHTHSDRCYGTWVLICGKEVHTHTDECYEAEETEETTAPTNATKSSEETTAPTEAEELDPNQQIALMAVAPETVIASGEIIGSEKPMTWTLTQSQSNEYTLTIDGEGNMPNYGLYEDTAWKDACEGKTVNLVFGDQVTSAGSWAFASMRIKSIDWGGVKTIGARAFQTCSVLTHLSIPGTVEYIGEGAFHGFSSLRTMELGEGIKEIQGGAFHWYTDPNLPGIKVTIPASVESIGSGTFDVANEIVVDPNNQHYTSVDGILYNKDVTVLIEFPEYKVMEEFHIPDTVTEIKGSALASYHLQRVYIPKSVKTLATSACAGSSAREIYIEDGSALTWIGQHTFINSSKLEKVVFPKGIQLSIGGYPFINTTYPVLESIEFPNSIVKLAPLGTDLTHFPALKNVVYDAPNAEITGKTLTDAKDYVLTVGPSVNVLPAGFASMAGASERILFAPNNSLEIREGALEGTGTPLESLHGTLHVDNQGVLYVYDAEKLTAQMVYCPPDKTSITVPATIKTENGEVCQVTAVRKDALYRANKLESIAFAAPENVRLEALSLANCLTLTSVNGKTTVEDASELFAEGNVGINAFYNTGLTGAPGSGDFSQEMNGLQALEVTKEGATSMNIILSSSGSTLTWIPAQGSTGSGGYRLLTGDTLTVTGAVGNITASTDDVYRLYFRVTGEDAALSIAPGKNYTFGDVPAQCYATADPYTVYLEFTPQVGKTNSVFATNVYPNPSSPGGGLSIWGRILSQEEATAAAGQILEAENGEVIQAYWTTEPDEFGLTKTVDKPQQTVNIVSGDSYGAKLAASIVWDIVFSRTTETTSAYGKDYVKTVDYVDVLSLPTGMKLHPDVVTALIAGNIHYDGTALYAGDVTVLKLSGSGANITGVRMVWDEAENAVKIQWRCENSGTNVEMNTNTLRMTLMPEALTIDTNLFNTQGDVIKNKVTAQVHYHYHNDAILDAEAEKPIGGAKANLAMKKTSNRNDEVWFGEDITYTVDVYNDGGLPYTGDTGVYTIRDVLPVDMYISPENMEGMFAGPLKLEITIEKANLAPWSPVKDAYGGTAWINSGNTEFENAQTQTLRITYEDEGYYVKYGDTSIYNKNLADALKMCGYALHYGDQYICTWTLTQPEEEFTVDPGEHIAVTVYATVKDTFRKLGTTDYVGEWPYDPRVSAQNNTWLYRDDKAIKFAYSTNYLRREVILTKSVSKNGKTLESPSALHGEVLDYHLKFTHIGMGSYDNLPLVDDLYGSQYLLVPTFEANNHLSGCDVHTDTDGTRYYILRQGSYSNVTVGVDDEGRNLIAASIDVGPAKNNAQTSLGGHTITYSGVHTRIKWYFSHLSGGNYVTTVSYKALVDATGAEKSFNLGNVAWMNDDPGSRLYAPIWGAGTILDFEKMIVTQKGKDADGNADPERDVLTDYSLIEPGEEVTYRIKLRNTGILPYSLNGTEIADALPNNHSVFEWSKENGNVVLSDIQVEGVTYTGLEAWDLGTSYNVLDGAGQQFVLWPSTTQVQFEANGTLYLYFTLTYPDRDGENLWDQYAASVRGNRIQNTWFLYTFSATVEHNLKESGEVLLQKGVYGMYHHTQVWNWAYKPASRSRVNYSNKDSRDRSVAYYVVIYNGNGKRLYLSNLQDRLPAGFTYTFLQDDSAWEGNGLGGKHSITTKGGVDNPFGSDPLAEIGSPDVVYRSIGVTAFPTDSGVTFKFSPGSGEYAASYDSERKQYYLGFGEAIVFAYTCDIGTTDQTEDSATNVIAMPYTDYLNTGVQQIGSNQLSVQASRSEYFDGVNDGKRYVRSQEEVSNDYGFDGNTSDWLVSDVTVYRGGIIPGVTKQTVSYTQLSNNSTVPYVNGVSPGADFLVNWDVKLHNSGTLAMTDYTVTEVMEAPYLFQGDVTFTRYDAHGSPMESVKLFTIPKRTESDTTLHIVNGSGTAYTLKCGNDPIKIAVAINSKTVYYYISLGKDSDGNEVLKLNCSDPYMAIPEGGYVLLQVSTCNPTNTYQSTVYTNRAQLVPNVQPFKSVGHGWMLRDENGDPHGAENASPVTVSFGYSTSSEKRVTEKNNPDNTAASTDTDDRAIVLKDKESVFTYTLTVNNDTDIPMTKLVLIDNLPEVGDHSPFKQNSLRNSAFGVSLADDPNFRVIITPEDHTLEPYELTDFTVEYSVDTVFGEAQGPDWCGESSGTTATWTNNPETARSIRLIIREDTAAKIPAKSSVSFSFDAVADSDADPGEIAWNSFGYHYALENVDFELESMPLPVGVAMPSVPALEKRLVAMDGSSVSVEDKLTFRFLLYKGEPLKANYETEAAWLAALNGRSFRTFTVEINPTDGDSALKVLDFDGWQWEHGATYSIVELPPASARYSFLRFEGTGSSQYTFTYDNANTVTVVCENRLEEWGFSLKKTDPDGNTLSGAVFALYSPSEADLMDPDEAERWNAQRILNPEAEGEPTWYLKAVTTTGEDGILTWTGLLEDSYYLLELQAPEGYRLSEEGRILYRSTDRDRVVEVINKPVYELPETGGTGTTSYGLRGALLTLAATALYIHMSKRRKKNASF